MLQARGVRGGSADDHVCGGLLPFVTGRQKRRGQDQRAGGFVEAGDEDGTRLRHDLSKPSSSTPLSNRVAGSPWE